MLGRLLVWDVPIYNIYIYINIPGIQMTLTLVLIGKGLVLEGSRLRIEDNRLKVYNLEYLIYYL